MMAKSLLAEPLRLSPRVSQQGQSMTFRVAAKVAALRRQGADIIDLALGEPELDTPAHIREAAKRAIDEGATRYTETAGKRELRAAAAAWLSQAYGVPIVPEQVLVSSGAKQALYNLFQVLLTEGDEVVIPSPLWTSYRDMVSLAGGKTILVPCEAKDGFLPDPEKVRRAFSERTRILLVNSPTNPTGAVYPASLLLELAKLCAQRGVLLLADGIYRAFCYDSESLPFAQIAEEAKAAWFIVDGVSKSYCMTGWRIGLGVGPEPLIRAMIAVQSHATSCPSSISQAAALAALTGPQDCVSVMHSEYSRRRSPFIERLRKMAGVSLPVDPQGAFYAFPSFEAFRNARSAKDQVIADDLVLAEYLIEEARVAVIPGSAFEAPWFLRLSYAGSFQRLEQALSRIETALSRLIPAG